MQITAAVLASLLLTVGSFECFRALQSTGYRPQRGYFKLCCSVYFLSLCVLQAIAIVLYCFVPFGSYINLGLSALFSCGSLFVRRKCPLKFTKRVCRMIAVQCVLLLLLCVFVNMNFWFWLLPVVTLASFALCLPLDRILSKHYVALAQKKLLSSNVKVIAITGSYGKTSVKNMLVKLLQNSICPQGSCNTPLGIAAYLNKTSLVGAEYLILEFGARKKGDIAQLCRLFRPRFGIVTGVCPQHLATFGSFQNVIAAKRELTERLPADGFCVLNQKDDIVAHFVDSGACAKYLSGDNLQVEVRRVSFEGTELDLTFDGVAHRVTLPQISDYIADTYAMCVQAALRLGQSVESIVANTSKVEQTPHRLQLVKGKGMYVLDDSYNGSLTGVESCCKTLKKFQCPKVVITQGLVECGKQRKEMNVSCGKMLGSVCDVAVVLGRNADALASGLEQTPCTVLQARSLKEAVSVASPYAMGGILLFQNDLPDVANVR